MSLGISILPSIITTANMGIGLYSITASIRGDWATAAWCIIVCILMDVFDGRIARWTNSASRFGLEFDSLADLISFGVAPAMMMYLLVLKDFGRVGFAIALFYVVCGALRLARFNLKSFSDSEPSPYFVGLPIPAGGGILASFVVLYDIWAAGKKARTIPLVMDQVPAFFHLLPGIIFVLALLMVSGLRYSSFKKMNLLKPRTLRAFLITLLVCLMVYIYPQNTLFVLFVAYICSGIFEYGLRMYNVNRRTPHRFHVEKPDPKDDDDFWKMQQPKAL